MIKTEKSKFILSGYVCNVCGGLMKVFSNDAPPSACSITAACPGKLSKQWSQSIEQSTTVSDLP